MDLLRLLLLLCISGCLCQQDCTGVDCPVLHNCIEQLLETNVCCPTCLQIGCSCEGYQYYDCMHAGFQNGRVPEGESYFVDFGSTECSCPQGGGRIGCHFIPCPELPANCIEVLEPTDGCAQCKRIGCTHMAQQYEAGHSFHVDPCQVCHCPNDGGKLMCYPIPDCDPRRTHKPTLTTSTEESPAWRGTSDPIRHVLDRQGSFSKPFALLHADKLPPFNLSPTHIGDEEEEEEEGEEDDYDYTTTDSFEPSSHDLVSPTGSSIVPAPHAENIPAGRAFREGAKQELKERFGVHKLTPNRQPFPLQDGSILALLDSKETTGGTRYEFHNNTLKKDALNISEDSTNEDQFPIYRANADNEEFSVHGDTQSFSLYKVNTDNNVPEEKNTEFESFAIPKETADSGGSDYEHIAYTEAFTPSPAATTQTPPRLWETEATAPWPPTDRSVWAERTLPLEPDAGADSVWRRDEVSMTLTTVPSNDVTDSGRNPEDDRMDDKWEETTVSSLEAKTESDSGRGPVRSAWSRVEIEGTPGSSTAPTMRFRPTSQPLEDKRQTLGPFHVGAKEEVEREEKEHHLGSFPKGHEALVENCCGAGQKWAVEKQHCDRLPPGPGPGSMCGMVQQQCCVAALRERRCLLGINSAKTGEMCEESSSPQCGEDSQKECCSCCALGLRMRRESKGCDMHRYLSYPCGHIFLTCCEEEEHEEARTPELRRKERPIPTTLPKKVADGQYSKQPLSVEDSELVANSVEKPKAVDECQRHERQPCHHRCISTTGSYRCACHPGYVLQQDGHACVLENPEEDNRVREEDRLFTLATSQLETLTRTPPPHDPCAGGGPCSQRCAVVRGLPRCSCFLGYSLKADGHTCEDVDECSRDTHKCSMEEVCVNTEGSYQCARLNDRCDVGFIHNHNEGCVDLNECVTNTHTCQHHERCVNTVGAFMCEKQMSCPSGYQLRNGVCEDVDECAVRSHDCEPGAECLNTVGSFHCKQRGCLGGFSQDPHGNCIDVDECSRLQDPCSAGFHCINTVGSYTCQRKTMTCNRGYHSSPDEARCVDVNECAMGTHHCTESQVCHNLPGSYRCDCRSGYQYDSIRRLCVDVNECWRYPGRLCAQTCDNTVGSYQCSCTAGFSLAFDGKNCEDLNECDNNPCSQECANIYGSYQCYCRLGYYLKEDGHTCEDINECSQSIGNLCAFQCVNVPGSYQCACPPEGYSMSPNGRTCRDVDECATGTHNCTAAGQTCYNLPGSFRCLDFSCPDNYRRASDKRCERVSCSSWLECQSMPLRITYYQLSFQTNIVIPAQIFRIGPSPAYSGDNIVVSIPRGNVDGYFGTRRLNSFTGAVYLQRQPEGPRDFFIDVEMKLLRQGALSTFLARIYVFITAHAA